MIDLKKDIKTLLKEQKVLIPRVNVMDKAIKRTEKSIEKHILKEWKKAKQKAELNVGVYGSGSHCVGFKLEAGIEIPLHELCGRKWFKTEYNRQDYKKTHIPVDPPVSMKFFKEFAERMTKELGISIKVSQSRMPTKSQFKKQVLEHGFEDFNGMNVFYDDDLKLIT